jgi:hypothetical protein
MALLAVLFAVLLSVESGLGPAPQSGSGVAPRSGQGAIEIGGAPAQSSLATPAEPAAGAASALLPSESERSLLDNSASASTGDGELHVRLMRWPLRFDTEELDALERWAQPGERLQMRLRDGAGRSLTPDFARLDLAHLDFTCRGAAPISVLAYQRGFEAAWLTASAEQVAASVHKPLVLFLVPDARLQLVWTQPPAPHGLDVQLVAPASWVPWTRAAQDYFAGEWPSQPLRVPSGGFDLWLDVRGHGRALYRGLVLAPGEVRRLEVVLQSAQSAGVSLFYAPSGAPVRAAQIMVLATDSPSNPDSRGQIFRAGEGVELTPEGFLRLPPIAPGPIKVEVSEPSAGMRFVFELLLPLQDTPTVAVPEPGSLRGRIEAGAQDLSRYQLLLSPEPLGGSERLGPEFAGQLSNTPIEPQPLAADGSFEIPRLAPGTWRVRMCQRGARWLHGQVLMEDGVWRMAPDLGTATVVPGAPAEFHAFAPLQAPGILEVLLVVDGEPLPHRSIGLYARPAQHGASAPLQRPAGERVGELRTDSGGRLRFEGLPAGSYSLVTCSFEAGPFVLTSGEHKRVELSLSGLRTSILAESEDGQALAGYRVALRRRGSSWYQDKGLDAAGQFVLLDYAGSFEMALLEHLRPRDPATLGAWVPLELSAGQSEAVVRLPFVVR